MLYPSIDKLLEKADSKYFLVVAAAKRARALRNHDPLLIEKPNSVKDVGKALEEIEHGKLVIEYKIREEK